MRDEQVAYAMLIPRFLKDFSSHNINVGYWQQFNLNIELEEVNSTTRHDDNIIRSKVLNNSIQT